jgi:hypothetical protein
MKKLFSGHSHKKASLEISVQAIVIVVLAMTLLGLGLGFVRNLFTDISSTTEDVQAQVKQRILDDLITNDKKLSFPKTEIRIDKGASEVMTIGLRNKKDTPLNYYLTFTFIAAPNVASGNPATVTDLNVPSSQNAWFQYDASPTQIPSADSAVRSVRLTVPTEVIVASGTKTITQGSYALTFKVVEVACIQDGTGTVVGSKRYAPIGTSGCTSETNVNEPAGVDLDGDGQVEETGVTALADVTDITYDQKDLFVVVKG